MKPVAEQPAVSTTVVCQLALTGGMPEVVCTARTGERLPLIGRVATNVATPQLDVNDGDVSEITALDILEHVMDEQAWLAELARILAPGGTLTIRVPAEGPTGWLDAINIYRYVTDTTGRGQKRNEALPTAWHRHYRPAELIGMVQDAGFEISAVQRTGLGLAELPHLTGFMIGDFLLGNRSTERTLHEWRQPIDRLDSRLPTGPIGTRVTVTARRLSDQISDSPSS